MVNTYRNDITNSTFLGSRNAIQIWACSNGNNTIHNCTFDSLWGDAIMLLMQAQNNTIYNNTFKNCLGYGIAIYDTGPSSESNLIYKNYFYDN